MLHNMVFLMHLCVCFVDLPFKSYLFTNFISLSVWLCLYIHLTPLFIIYTYRTCLCKSNLHIGSKRIRRRQWHPTPVLLPGKSHGQRSLEGCSPWGRWGSDTTEQLHFHFSLSCIGEGKGNPLQCSCLENPRDGGAWWAAVYGVAQSRTQLKWLSNSKRIKEVES